MRIGSRTIHADWGHLAFLTAMAAVIALYLADTLAVSTSVNNLALVLPASILGFVLYVFIAARAVRVERGVEASAPAATEDGEGGEAEGHVQTRADLIRAVILMLGLGVYVLVYPLLRLEPATFLFIAGSLWLLGMRRPFFVLLYSAIFTAVVIGGARALLSYPMPLLFF